MLAALLLLVWAAPGFAAYSGLTLIPTADVLGPGEVCVDYYFDGSFPVGSGVGYALFCTQYGVGNRLEMGVDFDLTEDGDPGALFNAKLMLRPVDSGLGLVLGVHNIAERTPSTTYLVATTPVTEKRRRHAGAQRTPEDETQGIAGLDYYFEGRLGFYGEYTAGDENSSMLSAYYQLTDRWGIIFGWARPNDSEADDWWAVDIGCVWPSE